MDKFQPLEQKQSVFFFFDFSHATLTTMYGYTYHNVWSHLPQFSIILMATIYTPMVEEKWGMNAPKPDWGIVACQLASAQLPLYLRVVISNFYSLGLSDFYWWNFLLVGKRNKYPSTTMFYVSVLSRENSNDFPLSFIQTLHESDQLESTARVQIFLQGSSWYGYITE